MVSFNLSQKTKNEGLDSQNKDSFRNRVSQKSADSRSEQAEQQQENKKKTVQRTKTKPYLIHQAAEEP